MHADLNYQVIEFTRNHQTISQTLGLYDLIGLELSIAHVIPKPIALGMLHQIASHMTTLVDLPSLFLYPWIPWIFKENTALTLLPFVLLEENTIGTIVVPDSNGHYPWQIGCEPSFSKQTTQSLLINNMLTAIKTAFLYNLVSQVASKVYLKIGIELNLAPSLSFEAFPDYLADHNLDLWILIMLCFNEVLPQINQYILKACQSLPLNIHNLSNPIDKAQSIAFQIERPSLVEQYTSMILQAFDKLNEL